MTKQTTRSRLALIIASSFLATGATLSLIYVLWPASPPPEAQAKTVPTSATLKTATDMAGGNLASKSALQGTSGPVRPASPVNAMISATGVRPPQHKALVVPPHTEANMIKGPVPWRRSGPPVITPVPGSSTAKSPQVSSVSPLVSPGGTNRNVRGQTLPFLLPARKMPAPIPDTGTQKTN